CIAVCNAHLFVCIFRKSWCAASFIDLSQVMPSLSAYYENRLSWRAGHLFFLRGNTGFGLRG
ncbi:MAG: hypothetical protein WAX67_01015, partial [Rugosibacter sp.]